MSDIFLSYGRTDRAIAHQFANALEALGWSVWWDREIPHGQDFDLVIERELNEARCAIVLWSKESVQSRWVRGEASAAATRNCLIPILIERVTPPLEFRQIQTAELIGWSGDTNDPEFVRLLESLENLIGRKPAGIRSSPARMDASRSRRRVVTGVIVLAVLVAGIVAFMSRNGIRATDERAQPSGSADDISAHDTSEASAPAVSDLPESAPAPPTTAGREDKSAPATRTGTFRIAIGDKIHEGSPGPGAGVIDTAHEKDVYTFDAQRGRNVFFQVLNHGSALGSIEWKLLDANDAEVFRSCLGCSQPGVQNLRVGGRYRLIVGSDRETATGTYRLQLHDVPDPNRFKVAIGSVIDEDSTGAGAGVIESPGVEDIYTFEAAPRQRVYFRVREHSSGIGSAGIRLLDSNETPIFASCLGCSEPGVQALTKGGSYTLIVGIRNDPSTGTYRLQLFDVPKPDEFTITLPAKIANGIPGKGAGLIDTPGAEDRYVMNVDAGQKLLFKLGDYDRTLSSNVYRLIADDGTELLSRCFGCSPAEPVTFSRGGRHVLIVGTSREASTGAYAIEIVPR